MLVILILLCVALIQSVVAKPLSACEIVRDENLKFSQHDSYFEWSRLFVNPHQRISACLYASSEKVEQIGIRIFDVNSGGIVGEETTQNRHGHEMCIQYISASYNDFVIKFNIYGELSKSDYIKICPINWPPATDTPSTTWSVPTWPSTDPSPGWTVPTWPSTDATPGWTTPTWPSTDPPTGWTVPTWPSTPTPTTEPTTGWTAPTWPTTNSPLGNNETWIPSNWSPPSTNGYTAK